MTSEEFAKLQRDFLIKIEKQSAIQIFNEFRLFNNQIGNYLTENPNVDLNSIDNLIKEIESLLDKLSSPFYRIVARAQRQVINFSAESLKNYLKEKVVAKLESSIFSPDNEAIKVLIGRTQSGEHLQKFFLRMKPDIAQKVKAELINGFSLGESNSQIAKRITDVSDVSRYRAMTISRTETNEAYRTATREFYGGADVKKYVWKSIRDHRTCLICWTLHNRVFKTSKKVFSRPNCRCVLLPYFGEDLGSSNDDFLKLESGYQKQILGPKRFEMFQSGNLKIGDFVKSEKTKGGENFSIKNLSDLVD